MRICIVYQASSLAGCERIEKMDRTLRRAGHETVLVCNDYGDAAGIDHLGEMPVHRIGPTFSSRRINRLLKFPVFCNPLWVWQLAAAVRRLKPDALQVVDIPLAAAVLMVGRAFRIPVVLDMWENYPEALRIWAKADWRTLVFKNYRVARAVELYVTRRVDHIVTVIEEQRDRLIEDGVPGARISVVTNAVEPELFVGSGGADKTAMDDDAAAYKMLYVGAVTAERGLDDIIRALPEVLRAIPEVRFYIAGTGNDEPRLRRLADELGVTASVRYLGWIPFQEIHSYIDKSDLCLVPHIYSGFINTTIPNKLFQYMAMGKPVLVSHAKPLARIVRQGGCGLVFQSGDPTDAALKIVEMRRSPDSRAMGERGRRFAEEHFTWERAAVPYLRLYAELDSCRGSETPASKAAGGGLP